MEKFIDKFLFTSAGRSQAFRIIQRFTYISAAVFIAVMLGAFILRSRYPELF